MTPRDPDDAAILAAARAGQAPDDAWLAAQLAADWRRVFCLRVQYRDRLRALAGALGDVHQYARAAFGADPEPVPAVRVWLYRELYLDDPPAEPSVAWAIGRLRRGDPAPLADLLATPPVAVNDVVLAWYEVTTLTARVANVPLIEHAGVTAWAELVRAPGSVAGGPLPRCLDGVQVAQALRTALATPLGIEPHRQALVAAAAALQNGLAGAPAATTLALLRHHTDRPDAFGALPAAAAAWSDPARFSDWLIAGLRSPSGERRWLSYRLLRLAGLVSSAVHPDDAAP